ncbi:MAG: DUF3108 domain-containing protein [Gammaproteobacteria bacterium]|jgi:hypothetical protein|nr:DUF3108 domain-containing protein [Gammaproteobacteria bacterium]MBT5204557.1 DUF3108 domain-containing protein [Gammaproteobacteria bacterium]MBT5603743.1 DUF3108 domain-containing protein [Gammaproteobacteria bacterium]MBT6244821.1 DUF3108 domain-containing protein [Gammaproteobacteria bacterium]
MIPVTLAQPAEGPKGFKVTYKADYMGLPISAKGIRQLEVAASGQYLLKSSATSLFADVEEISAFQLQNGTARPEAYRYQRTGLGKNKKVQLRFDWLANTVTDLLNNTQFPLEPGSTTSDKLLYQFQLQADLLRAARQQTLPEGFEYTVFDEGRLKQYQFQIVGKEMLSTKLGQIKTWKIKRSNSATDRSTTLWMAPEYEFMLVRFEQTGKDNKGFSLMIEEAQLGGETIFEF